MYACMKFIMDFLFSGLHTSRIAPQWALPYGFMQWVDRGLISHNTAYNAYDLHQKGKSTTKSVNLSSEYSTELLKTAHNDSIVNSSALTSAVDESLSIRTEKSHEETHADSSGNHRKNFVEKTFNLLDIVEPTVFSYGTVRNRIGISVEPQEKISHLNETGINTSDSRASRHSTTDTNDDALRIVSDIIEQCEEALDDCVTSVSDNEPLDLVINSTRSAPSHTTYGEADNRLDEYLSVIDKETLPVGGAILKDISHSPDAQSCYNIKYKDYGLLQFSDLDKVSCNSDRGKELLRVIKNLHTADEVNGKTVVNDNLKLEKTYDILDKYVTHVLPSRLSDAKQRGSSWSRARSSVKCNSIKKEYVTKEEAHKTEGAIYNKKLNNWEYLEMSGQYPGRPPVGTPPPHPVWNHLTMAQGQGNFE